MSPLLVGLLGIAATLLLIAVQFPIGLALMLVSFVGVSSFVGFASAASLTAAVTGDIATNWTLSAIPMFLFMGVVVHRSGMTASLYQAARLWLGFLPGGLAVATNLACAGFGAACGSSLATTVAIGRFAIPEMLHSRYDRGLATGVCACAGTIGILIPPSIPMVIYGIFAGVPVTDLFIAGIIPGLLTAAAYTAMIVARCAADPRLAPPTHESADRDAKWRALADVWPFPLLALLVIGGLYAGWVTPTEAGALGAGASLVVALGLRTLSWRILWQAARETTTTTAAILFVAIGAGLLTKLMAFSGVPQAISAFVAESALHPLALIVCVSLVYIVLGMFLDPLGLILLTLPIFLPLFQAQGLDLLWFGILLVKFV
ncbi:MAG: TRAP transporter large permease, partial [Candidatus Eiseniibacteriota bacterium]